VRVRSKWSKKDKTHTVEEIGAALAFIAWRIAANTVLNLENHEYQTDTQSQRLDIIGEILTFTIHIIDRMTIERFSAEERQRFMGELALKSAKHMEDNRRDVQGSGEYKQAFIDLLNQRMADYADFSYSEQDGPGFPMKRYFGDFVAQHMGEKNRQWVSGQISEIEVREIMATLKKSVPNLFM